MASWPHRNRRIDGLEVEVGDRRFKAGEIPAEAALHDDLAHLDASDLPACGSRRGEAAREIVKSLDAVCQELDDLALGNPVEGADVMVGERGPASSEERTLVRCAAMGPGRDVG